LAGRKGTGSSKRRVCRQVVDRGERGEIGRRKAGGSCKRRVGGGSAGWGGKGRLVRGAGWWVFDVESFLWRGSVSVGGHVAERAVVRDRIRSSSILEPQRVPAGS